MAHECPRCGRQTDGSWSEGGLLWAICEDCMEADLAEQRAEREHYQQQLEERDG